MNSNDKTPSIDQHLQSIRNSTYTAIRRAEEQTLGDMMRDTTRIIDTLNMMISEASTARRVAVNKKHREGFTYRDMADEIGISFQRVAQIARGNK